MTNLTKEEISSKVDQLEADGVPFEDLALRTLSPNYFGDTVSLEELKSSISDYVEASKKLDSIKSRVFYGRNKDKTPAVTLDEGGLIDTGVAIDPVTLHCLLGIASEGGEIMENALKALDHGVDVDHVNIEEESGDILWFMGVYAKHIRNTNLMRFGFNIIKKLMGRFGDKYDDYLASNRNLGYERTILEESADRYTVSESDENSESDHAAAVAQGQD